VEDAFQENRILSHDLLEGCYARSGLVSDVFLYEENPSQYLTTIKRHTRWIRGDWQIGAWTLPYISNKQGKLTPNKLSTLSRWKIFDNLRRSLLPLSFMLLLLCGGFIFPLPWFWTLTVTFMVLVAVMAAAGWQLAHKPDDVSLKELIKDSLLNPTKQIPAWSLEKPGLPGNQFLKAISKADPDGNMEEVRAYLENNTADRKAKVSTKLNFLDETDINTEMSFNHFFIVDAKPDAKPVLITKGFYRYNTADFTPDGKHLIIAGEIDSTEHPDRSLDGEIFIVNADGRNLKKNLG